MLHSESNCRIMINVPNNLTKRYYTIGEVAAMFQVSRSLIRFWEKEFLVLRLHKSSKGERRFTADNIRLFEQIFNLVKVKGYTLEGARKYLREEKDFLKQKKETIRTLRNLKGFLEDLKLELD